MATLKTRPNDGDITAYLDEIEDEQKRADSLELLEMMHEITGEQPRMWGASIIGFGSYHYKYESGREGDWFITGFAPRKSAISLHIMSGFDRYETLLEQLGKHKTGKSCLYIKKLDDIDRDILKKLITASVHYMNETYHNG